MPDKLLSVANREIGQGRPCFVIAEVGVNHNGDLDMACRMIDVAADAGADAVKFQTFKAIRVVTPDAPKADYQQRNTGDNDSQFNMLCRLELSSDAHRMLLERCQDRGLIFMSTPFDEESADFLDELGVPVYKVASGEVTNLPFLDHVARKGKPVIVSTGMCNLGEVEAAVDVIRQSGNEQVVLLHCVSNYPARATDVNLRAMSTLAAAFGIPVGYSDHTEGIEVALASVAMGACVVEKHYTLDRNLPGPDHIASVEPDEFIRLVRGIRVVESAMGDGRKVPTASEANTAAVARRSLVAASRVTSGTVLTDELIAVRRPGTGLPPSMREQLVGRVAREDIPAGALLTLEKVA